jgi:hypothetical protein
VMCASSMQWSQLARVCNGVISAVVNHVIDLDIYWCQHRNRRCVLVHDVRMRCEIVPRLNLSKRHDVGDTQQVGDGVCDEALLLRALLQFLTLMAGAAAVMNGRGRGSPRSDQPPSSTTCEVR